MKVGCEPDSKNLMPSQPDTKCDGKADCKEAGKAQCDTLPKCAAFSSSESSKKWKPQYYGKVDCSDKKGSKVEFSIKQPEKNVANVARKADSKTKVSGKIDIYFGDNMLNWIIFSTPNILMRSFSTLIIIITHRTRCRYPVTLA